MNGLHSAATMKQREPGVRTRSAFGRVPGHSHHKYKKMKTQNHSLLLTGRAWALALVATFLTVTTLTASAKDEVPYKLAWTITGITAHEDHPDGSYVETTQQVGTATHSGRITAVDTYHVASPLDWGFDPATLSLLAHFVGTSTKTSANGDSIVFVYTGIVVVPLDDNFPFDAAGNPNILPPPYSLSNIWEITGGTGRYAGASGHGTSEGTVVGDGTSFGVSVGVISTVGSNKK